MAKKVLRRRRSVRLKGFDYAQSGAYFVTICVQGGECVLGEITAGGTMQLSAIGEIVDWVWHSLPNHRPHIRLDAWVIMPNHVHGILFLDDGLNGQGRGEAFGNTPQKIIKSSQPNASPLQPQTNAVPERPLGTKPNSLPAIIQNFKSITSRRINSFRKASGMRFWQRNYWEHVIRNDQSLHAIRAYIIQNPTRWAEDQLHPAAPPNQFNTSLL